MNGWLARQEINGGLAAALLLASSLLTLQSGTARAQQAGPVVETPLRIAAGPASEPMFGMAAILANIVSNPPGGPSCGEGSVCGFPGLVSEARATASSVENLESLADGQSETAIVEGDLLWQARNGFGRYAGRALGDLRALAVLYNESVLIVVRSDSKIDTIGKLRGKAVAMGTLDNPHTHTIAQILIAHGVREKEMTRIQLTDDVAASALADGEIDAVILVEPSLPPAFREIAERTPLRLLPILAATVEPLTSQFPYLVPVEIGDLAEARDRTPGLALPVLWVATQQLPAPVAYGVVRSLMAPANRKLVEQTLPSGSAVAPEKDLRRSPIPLHPGAARYFEEQSGLVR